MLDLYNGIPIRITTIEIQRRKHRKYRINKKWLKKYGNIEYEIQPYGTVYLYNGYLYMTKKDYKLLTSEVEIKKV